MKYEQTDLMSCTEFEDVLSDYIDRSLPSATQRSAAEHALSCPLCHALMNDVKSAVAMCREMSEPRQPVTRLEARILERTAPETGLSCEEFEEHLTDYLDGFLPARVFHRSERHTVLCGECSDLPGTVVRSLAACVAYKAEELPVPAGLHSRIMLETVGSERRQAVRRSVTSRLEDFFRGLRFPVAVPQLAPVVMMLLFAVLVFSQTVSADGTLSGVYTKSFDLAEETYRQGADAFGGRRAADPQPAAEPVTGTTFVEDKK